MIWSRETAHSPTRQTADIVAVTLLESEMDDRLKSRIRAIGSDSDAAKIATLSEAFQ